MHRYEDRIERLRAVLSSAEGVLIGGGSGLSAAAGLTYSGPRFTENFADFIEKYGVEDMYSASFYPFRTPEELWAHWARHIHVNRYAPEATPLYRDILATVEAKPHFVITTNVESQFEKAGFLPERIFEVQGNYAYFQCAVACHDKRYYNESQIKEMLASTADCKVPSSLVPSCPVCGGPMDVNLRHNEYFVQDASWHESSARFGGFIEKIEGRALVCLELGVGFNTPGIIRYPFEKLVYRNDKATLVRLNRGDPRGFPENERRTIAFDEDMRTVIQDAARS
ncbi:MAG TPA: Sir2 silent information regulator family NAD-dependent deacetylase [Treponema sp.]|nr:MAG: Sir2 silent information regulator family NAD-dependent deacetylase [Treponema sp. GWC1_61_84]OHE75451.1 MAG: Sir2 silent information regulator family NAD-dependent deacetylase [Treponema sp. RIFOXYC1_FULL_61_9]HCM27797.1 Sir2 silent information regulator family NAD-dependent deacetylase [Treponema sp.]